MTPVIGIDLGTTNTVAAVVQNGQAAALKDDAGQALIPSVVSFHPNGTVLVGRPAKERRLVDASNTIYSVKRLIGRSWDTEEVRTARSRFPFEMREGPGQASLVVARGETYTLPEISAFVLRKAKAVAEAALGVSVERAVITVPANFNDLQRAATKVAGRVAGLEVLRILNEPTAAALAYGFGRSSSERLAVYDFGGGTFDVTLLDLSDNVFEVLATAGNTFLGGDDIDLAIAERMADEFLARHRYDPRSHGSSFERLRSAAELLKQRLSFEDEVRIEVPDIAHGPGGKALGLDFAMRRTELEQLITPIVDRTFAVCREALGIARRSVQDFGEVLLVGGSTRVPLVRKRVEEFFQRELKANISPDEVVAIGAAIQANALTGAERRRATLPPAPAAARRSPPNLGTLVMPPLHGQAPSEPRPRLETLLGVPPPSSGGPSRVEPTASTERADGPRSASSAAPRTGSRTSSGLGPPPSARADAPRVIGPTLVSASEEARRARDSVSDLLPVVDSESTSAAAVREESAAFALGDGDIEFIYTEEEITKRGGNVEIPIDDEPTQSGQRGAAKGGIFERPTLPDTQARGGTAAYPPPPPPPPPPSVPALGQTVVMTPFRGELDDRLPLEQPVAVPRGPDSSAPPSAQHPGVITGVMASIPAPIAPLLIDVTPLTLTVETVHGFCDSIITRNTPVPCQQTREFVTAADGQTIVRVRVAQGESRRFSENTLLGEVELSGIRPMPRGSVQIAVTFALDTNGMLSVSAAESATGKATAAALRLIGLPEPHDVAAMAQRQNARQTF